MTNWNIEKMSGYKPKTTFWEDFQLAELFGGKKAVENTYRRAFKEWKDNVEYLTELVMVLNHRIFVWYDMNEMEMARLYDKLWKECDAWCMDNLKGKDLTYYIRTTD